MMMNFENNNQLPMNIRIEMHQNPELGVCVVYKDNRHNIWHAMQHSATKFATQRVQSLVFDGKVSDFEHDFVIVNKDGEICSRNCDAKIAVDEYGIIHVENDRCLIKPLENALHPQYVSAKNMEELNKKINYLVRAKQVGRPDGFGKYGYPTESESASQPNF